jgi:hypothetical protein
MDYQSLRESTPIIRFHRPLIIGSDKTSIVSMQTQLRTWREKRA